MAAPQATKYQELGGRVDVPMLCAIGVLLALGVVMVASSSMSYAVMTGQGAFYYINRHLLFLAVGLGLAAVALRTEIKQVEKYGYVFLGLCFLALVSVWIPGLGHSVNGARRWVRIGPLGFQAVEAVKLMFIVWLSSYLVRYRDQIGNSLKTLLKPLGIACALVFLLLLQPDFGSSALLLAITLCMVWLGGANQRHIVGPAIVMGIAMGFIAWMEPYRVKRLTSFLDPWADQFDSGFQLVQAFIAIGRGGLDGVGLGGSILKLDYLPEAHTDFIFSVYAEEFGFIGVCLLVLLFGILTWRAFRTGLGCLELNRPFAAYCAFGLGLWISIQATVSVGVNLGLLPTKGLTLPLISSGGSSLMMTCAAMGLLLRISYELDRARRQRGERTDAPRSDDSGVAARDDGRPSPAQAAARIGGRRIEPKAGATA
ncbi:MAG: putative lipid II flippase FtsW [Arenimonas sp.]|nr:putative lipid II flippase FtsW [Arenimonas sp.]